MPTRGLLVAIILARAGNPEFLLVKPRGFRESVVAGWTELVGLLVADIPPRRGATSNQVFNSTIWSLYPMNSSAGPLSRSSPRGG